MAFEDFPDFAKKKAFWIRTPLNYRKSDFGVGFGGNGATGLCDEFKLYFVLSQCVTHSGVATCGHKKTAQPFRASGFFVCRV